MKFTRRGNAMQGDGGQAGWCGPPRLAERSCCCPAIPVVRVLIPPACERPHPADLLLCGHHYLASKAALAAVGAVVIDETGTVVDPPSASGRTVDFGSDRLFRWPDARESSIEIIA